MAHPHPTPTIPGHWPHLLEEVARCASPDAVSRQLEFALGPTSDSKLNVDTELAVDAENVRQMQLVVPGHVCATAWVFSPDASHVLLVRHRTFGWSSPGGHIEPHETSREGGLRELEEETGLTRFDVVSVLDVPALVHVSDLPGDRPHRHWNVAWLYTAEMDSPLSPLEGARWWPPSAPPQVPPDSLDVIDRLTGILRQTHTAGSV